MALVLDSLASYVQSILSEMAKEEVHMLIGVSGEIDKMSIRLKDLKKFLIDADRRNITNEGVQEWVVELRHAMYEATDILDLCQLKAMEQGPSMNAGCLNPLLFCLRNPLHAHDIGSRIKKLNQRLDDIRERSAAFNFIDLSTYKDSIGKVTPSHLAKRETSGLLDSSGVVGESIEVDTRDLVKMLTWEQEVTSSREVDKIVVFAIVGVGGIGKTTLAQKIFNDDNIKKDFDKMLWLSINKNIDPTDLLCRAITEAGGDHQKSGNAKATLQENLKNVLEGRKTLLVMDDVWDHYLWDDVLKTPLANSVAQGSRVLVTTRHEMVAQGMMAKEPYHHVQKLDQEDAWVLLKKQVVENGNGEHEVDLLKDIGMGIIVKCDCLPLAVKVIGGLLRQKERRRGEWEKVLNDSMWSGSKMTEDLNYAIYLSYEDLHSSLKQCFLHFSFIPKDVWFQANAVVEMWISEGFVHGNSQELEELGREYYNELISRNLLERVSDSGTNFYCEMHDVVRSFAHYVAKHEALVVDDISGIDITSKLNSQRLHRLTMYTEGSVSNKLEWASLQEQKSLRTLLVVGDIQIKPGDSLVNFSSLRMLHLNSTNCEAFVESLCQLKHLRYLGMEDCGISFLPENIGKMKFLQFISFASNERLVELPRSILELGQLRSLNIHGTRITIPKGFYTLKNLRDLEEFPAHMDGEWCSLEELGPLSQLRKLRISGLENVSTSSFAKKARLGEKVHLKTLFLTCNNRRTNNDWMTKEEEDIFEEEQQRIKQVFDELQPPPCLEDLEIIGYFAQRLPGWMMSTESVPLGSLRMLLMNDLTCCIELPDGLCQLPSLEVLQIKRAQAINLVGPEFQQPYQRGNRQHIQVLAAFPRLRKLIFNGMVEWEDWEWEEHIQAMPILQELQLQMCKLRHVPRGLSLHARALSKLFLYDVMHLTCLENFASVVHLGVSRNPDLERINNFPKLNELVILSCPKLKILEGLPALQRVDLEDPYMEMLPKYLKDVKPQRLQLGCTLSLLTCMAAGEYSGEWGKFSHIQEVKAYANDEDVIRKWYMLYARSPFNMDTNISCSAVASRDEEYNMCMQTNDVSTQAMPMDPTPARFQLTRCLSLTVTGAVFILVLSAWLHRVLQQVQGHKEQ